MPPPLHPLHAIFLASALPLFFGVLLNDLAYASSYEVQWKNFASWLLVGGLAMGLVPLLWAMVNLVRRISDRSARSWAYAATLWVMWILGFMNALVHASDVWASMPEGLILSALGALLSVAAVWLGFSNIGNGRARVPA